MNLGLKKCENYVKSYYCTVKFVFIVDEFAKIRVTVCRDVTQTVRFAKRFTKYPPHPPPTPPKRGEGSA